MVVSSAATPTHAEIKRRHPGGGRTHGHDVAGAGLDKEAGRTVTFRVTNNFRSSSILPLGTHTTRSKYPDAFLAARGFNRVATRWTPVHWGG